MHRDDSAGLHLSAMDEPMAAAPPWWRRYRIGLSLLAGALLAAVLLLWLKAPALPQGLSLQTVRRGNVDQTAAGFGTFISLSQVAIAAGVGGTVTAIMQRPGDAVAAGSVLIKLVNPKLHNQFERAQLEARQVQLEQDNALADVRAHAALVHSTLIIAGRRAEVASAELSARRALAQRGIVSKLALLKAQAQQAEAQVAVENAKRALRYAKQAAQRRARMRQELLALAQSRVDELAQQVRQLAVRAPVAGVVKRILVQLGSTINAGRALTVVGPLSPDGARLRFPAADLARLKPGIPVALSYNGQQLAGRIERVDPDLSDGFVVAEVRAQHLSAEARVGLSVRGTAQLGRLHNVLYVRDRYPLNGKRKVTLWIQHDGHVRSVRTAKLIHSGAWLVLPGNLGLQAGDRVALEVPQ